VLVLRSGDPGQGPCLGERSRVGRFDRWASSPWFSFGRPCDLLGLSFELVSVCVVVPLLLPPHLPAVIVEVRQVPLPRWTGRAIGLDVHRDFCVVAVCEDGQVRSTGRVPSTPEGIGILADCLLPTDRVALEVTGSCWEVARLLEPHVNRVVVVSPDDTGIAAARAKTDKLDARALALLLWRGELEAVWMPDERCRVLRRRLQRRQQLVFARTRAKNEIHAVLQRRLKGKPPCSDLFGVKGREWLAAMELPLEERESVDAGIRQVEFLDAEIAAVERLIAQQALSWPEIRRLMTVPGVNLICAASFIAAVGDTRRFMTSSKLVAYLGLDPRVRQSGEAPARSGRISKRGSGSARWALVEAAWSTVHQPGPLHAFYERTRARRGHGKAIVATARKLTVLFWCMLTRNEDYAHQQPSLTKKKLHRLEITAGAPKNTRKAAGVWSTNDMMRDAERALAEQAEASYKRMVQDQKAGGPARKVGASVTVEHA
jgi:transposase